MFCYKFIVVRQSHDCIDFTMLTNIIGCDWNDFEKPLSTITFMYIKVYSYIIPIVKKITSTN